MNLGRKNTDQLNLIIDRFLVRYDLSEDDKMWEIRESPLGGFGVFVKRDVDVGAVIFKDFPIILGPRCVPDCPQFCVTCYSKCRPKSCIRCGLPICSQTCRKSSMHLKECKLLRQYRVSNSSSQILNQKLFENFTPCRALLLDSEDKQVVLNLLAHQRDNHGHEIDSLKNIGLQFKENDETFLRFVCCALDANAFEVTIGKYEDQVSLRGLYPLGSLVNHSCVPNVVHVFNDKREMVARAAVFIKKDSEIFYSYTRIIWGTTLRLFHLQTTKHFTCRCARCKDSTEFGTFMSSILCRFCRGIVNPINPYKTQERWQCMDCKNVLSGKDAGHIIFMIGSVLKNIEQEDFSFMYRFLTGKLTALVPETNFIAVDLKYRIVWILGHKEGYKWNEMSLNLLKIKELICCEILNLLEKLRCGRCKMRGLILYELICCRREIANRQNSSVEQLYPDFHNYLKEASEILKYDASAPDEIKCLQQKLQETKLKI